MAAPDPATIAATDAIGNYLYPCRADARSAAIAALTAARPVIEAEATARERQRIRQQLESAIADLADALGEDHRDVGYLRTFLAVLLDGAS